MSRSALILTVLSVALIGFLLFTIQPDRTSYTAKKRPEVTRKAGSGGGLKKSSTRSSGGETAGSESTGSRGSSSADGPSDSGETGTPRFHLPYEANVAWPVREPDPGSSALSFDIPAGEPITTIAAGVVAGVSGPAPRPGEDLVFGRSLPRNAVLVRHADSSFALYQNVRAVVADTGVSVPDRLRIAVAEQGTAPFKLSISHPYRDDYVWRIVTKHHPRGVDLRPGRTYLRADSDRDHPANAVERTVTTDAGGYRKGKFRRGETVRLTSRFAFPVDADIRFAFRKPESARLFFEDARLEPGRLAARYDLTPDETRNVPGTTWTAYVYLDEEPADSVRFDIEEAN